MKNSPKGFKKKDIKKYKILNKKVNNETGWIDSVSKAIKVKYDNKKLKKVNLPIRLFYILIIEERPDLEKYFPYKIRVKDIKEMGDNDWIKKAGFLGLNGKKRLDLYVNPRHKKFGKFSLSLLWLLLHEFRHHVQYQNKNISSCQRNKNRDRFYQYICQTTGCDLNTAEHVFHEIDPFEIDAYTFASEILGIPYPGSSKFNITKKTLKKLFEDIV